MLRTKALLKEFRKLTARHLAIAKDLVKETGTDGLAGVCGHDRATPVLVAQEYVAAFDAQNAKTGLRERSDEFGARDTRRPAHAAIVTRWIPTNSNSCSGTPSTSRHSPIASRMRSVTSSSERACVWHAGIVRGYVIAF